MKKVLLTVLVVSVGSWLSWEFYDWSIIKLIENGIIPDNGYGLDAEVENWKNIFAYLNK